MVMDLINEEFSKLVSSIRSEIFNTYPSTLYHLTFKENLQILIDDFNKNIRRQSLYWIIVLRK